MKIKIYDYNDHATEIELEKHVKMIFVTVITGDEIISIIYEDGSTSCYDSSSCRRRDYYDGHYVVNSDQIEEWANMEIPEDRAMSYARLDRFA